MKYLVKFILPAICIIVVVTAFWIYPNFGPGEKEYSTIILQQDELSKITTNLQTELNNLRSENQNQRDTITELTVKLRTFDTVFMTQSDNEKSIQILNRVIERLPGIKKKLAFIKELKKEKDKYYLILDYVDWFSGDEAIMAAKEDHNPSDTPNGFYIRNKQIDYDKVLLEENTLIYVLEGALTKNIEFNKFISEVSNQNQERLFNILITDGNVTLLEEQYRP
ncbi:hypothetical protein M5X11_04360 [Paenibacillus alginolyticus]|uniref:hypothetical protein n=1 Tax=Paenibacillus alginolyticus TaxID=59839 RepID=UPI00040CCA9C|nr:hypothetical protein [Paenibacillus alginolyticus]MCY9664211.1 hypothetical protein [Paenibacillus alginolyticus]